MSENKENFKILTVTVKKKYYIPMIDNVRTKINGWTMEEVLDDWFKQHSLASFHATRDGHEIMGGATFIKSEVGDT